MKTSVKLFCLAIVFTFPVIAKAACPVGGVHTTHLVTVNKSAVCVLSKLFEQDHFCLVDANGNDISNTSLNVVPGTGIVFNLVFDDDTDFNMEYALTCVADDGNYVKSPKVIFNIGADGPAEPAISTTNLYGAQGTWVSNGAGEDYSIVF